jgi:CDP-4-dehydro-6-deoxyglucose reductase
MQVVANDIAFDIDETTSLLQALHARGIAARFSCRNGNCGQCEARLNSGRVWLDDTRTLVDAPATLLLCRAFARGDVVVEVDVPVRAVARFCRVIALEAAADAHVLRLLLPAGRVPAVLDGDGVQLDGTGVARIIAVAHCAQRVLELHLQADDHEWLQAARQGSVRIRLPVALNAPLA